jgi:hypothetical protein
MSDLSPSWVLENPADKNHDQPKTSQVTSSDFVEFLHYERRIICVMTFNMRNGVNNL